MNSSGGDQPSKCDWSAHLVKAEVGRRADRDFLVMSDTGGVNKDLRSMCVTCGSQFDCFGGRLPAGLDDGAWFECGPRCGVCSGPLDDGRAIMEHPGLGALIHLACSPVPSELDATFELL